MKKYAFLLLFALLCLNSFSQLELKPPPSKTPTTSDWEIEEQNHNCLHRNKYSRLERLQFYPFNKASYIKIVSFNGARIDSSQTPPHRTSGLPRKNDTICYKAIYESANPTAAQLDSLTDILYNVGYSGPVHSISENDCFNSRNAIVFLNKKGKILAYIEICFECERYSASTEQITIGDICNQKYELIRKFFISLGINHGTITPI